MRTTVRLDADVLAAAQRLRRERGIGLGEAVNELAREGLRKQIPQSRRRFRQRTQAMGMRIDVSRGSEVWDVLDQSDPELA